MENTIAQLAPTNSVESKFHVSGTPPGVTESREASRVPPTVESGTRFPLWYALRVKTGRETAVSQALRAGGIPEFLPTFTEKTQWSDRTKVAIRALFPGYVFANFDRNDAAHIWLTSGVLQILGTDELSSISADEIANLRTVCASPSAKAVPYVAGSSRVRVVSGPFAGVVCVVTRVKGETQLTIPVEILGRSVAVQIEAGDVEILK
jgi:transcription antitermination factor NusG